MEQLELFKVNIETKESFLNKNIEEEVLSLLCNILISVINHNYGESNDESKSCPKNQN